MDFFFNKTSVGESNDATIEQDSRITQKIGNCTTNLKGMSARMPQSL